MREAEARLDISDTTLSETVARYLYKLMAYKDEYEVARLYTSGDFERRLKQQFEGDFKLRFHLAPAILSPKNPKTGQPRKIEFGPWMFLAFKVLARLKVLRGTALDIFGYHRERRRERQLIVEYCDGIERMMSELDRDNYSLLVEIASLPEIIKGYGHIKNDNIKDYATQLAMKTAQWKNGKGQVLARAA